MCIYAFPKIYKDHPVPPPPQFYSENDGVHGFHLELL